MYKATHRLPSQSVKSDCQINDCIAVLRGNMETKLGFGPVPKLQYIYVNKQNDYCWYMLSDNQTHIPIYEN